MKHPALTTDTYKKAFTFMKEGTSFFIQNQYDERKWFVRGSAVYNLEFLRNFFKLEYDLGDEVVVIPCAL